MRIFLLRYQFTPADQACAAEADVAGSAKVGKAALSMSSAAKRATTWNAPQPPFLGSNGWRGVRPVNDALSPVSTQPAEISHAVFCKSAEAVPVVRLTRWSEIAYS